MQKTKIICTMGPASSSPVVLREMIRAGMNVARINMAHGELADHAERMREVVAAAKDCNAIVPILMDIKGPEVRIGKLQADSYELKNGDRFVLTTEQIIGDGQRVSVNYEELPLVVGTGSKILIDDGLIELRVQSVEGTEIGCTVISGGKLKQRKGVNLPGIKTTLPGITARDIEHIRFGIEQQVDIIAVSFVRKAADILEVKQILEDNRAAHIQVISKIENEEGVADLDAIIEVSDGIMVARGDLGVEIPVEDVPTVQQEIIEKCNRAGKPVIVATHMLESMQVNPRPTRAEVTDVTHAVYQGADIIMLSGETAAGKYPVESVATMAQIARKAEKKWLEAGATSGRRMQHAAKITEIISQAAVRSSLELHAKAIITPTESGFTARMVSKYRPSAPIIAITSHDAVLKKLVLLWGVFPVKGDAASTTDELFEMASRCARQYLALETGDWIVVSAGVPVGQSGTTNLLKVQQVGAPVDE